MKIIGKRIVIFFSTLIFVASVFAQGPGPQPIDGAGIAEAIKNLIAGYGDNQREKFLFVPSPDFESNIAKTSADLSKLIPKEETSRKATNEKPVPILDSAPFPEFLPDQVVFNLMSATNPAAIAEKMIDIGGLPVPEKPCAAAIIGKAECRKKETASLNSDSLLLPLQYTEEQQQIAMNFLRYASGIAFPIPVLDFSIISNPKELEKQRNRSEVQLYLAAVRTQIADMSVGATNLYQLYSERVPVKVKEEESKSPLLTDQQMATRRLIGKVKGKDNKEQSWYALMENASPAVLSREALYLLAEIRYEMYRNRLLNERILATLSAMEIQQSGNSPAAVQAKILYDKLQNEEIFSKGQVKDQNIEANKPRPPDPNKGDTNVEQ